MPLRITVVTPSYNQGQYLEETIHSVLSQDYPDLEYIVIDGGSTDNSVEIIQRYANSLAYWISEPDEGQADAINKGFARSTGAIMGWLNSDDTLLPGSLHTIAQAFESAPQTQIVTGFRKVYDANSRFQHNYFDCIPTDEILRIRCSVLQETTYWRREVWEAVGPLDISFNYALDFEYWNRMLDAGYHFTLLPHYLGGFRTHPDSKGVTLEHVRGQELARLYQQRGIGQDEADAFRHLNGILGIRWEEKLHLIRRLCRHSMSDNPRNVLRLYQFLQIPLLSTMILNAYRLYRRI